MIKQRLLRTELLILKVACLLSAILLPALCGRVAGQDSAGNGAHPLDPALKVAYDGLAHIKKDIRDYTARVRKRERINGTLIEEEMFVKIRNRQVKDGKIQVPFSIYLRFLAPPVKNGREVVWVEGRNEGKLIAHEAGLLNLFRIPLDPKGPIAMMGNRYPIYHIGFIHLVEQMIEKGERDRKRDECQVEFKPVEFAGRQCTLIETTHPKPRPYFDYHIARIYVDDELNIPLRYAAYMWPEAPGGEPVLDEEYAYYDVKLNVGLTDKDFDPDNPAYAFP